MKEAPDATLDVASLDVSTCGGTCMVQTTEKPIRPAASLLIVRDGQEGVEVLTLKRASTMRFLPGYLAFPGGALEAGDTLVAQRWRTQLAAQNRPDDRTYAVAAIRECAEEIGWLCGVASEDGQVVHTALTAAEQDDLLSGEGTFESFLQARGLWLDGEQIRFVGRWVTPAYQTARFDTRFFVLASQPADAQLQLHTSENQWVKWCQPAVLLAAIDAGTENAVTPTRAMLQQIAKMSSAVACIATLCVPGPEPQDDP